MSKDGSGNLLGPSLTLNIDSILEEFEESSREKELKQVTFLMLRNVSLLRRVYSFYSGLGHDRSPDNTFVMTRFQFWRFLKDCRIHHHKYSLSAMDRVIAKCQAAGDIHNPMEKLLLREFLTNCVVLSYTIYNEDQRDSAKNAVLSRCLQRLLNDHILKYSCRVGGHFLFEPRRAVNALAYMDKSWHIYRRVCTPSKEPPYEPSFCMRQFLFLLKDLKIISPQLSTRAVLRILSADDPSVSDGDSCNMEVEMTFLEFFEALVGIAVNFINNEMIQTSVSSEHPQERFSRPGSSVTQTVSEPGATNPALSSDSFSQADEDRVEGAQQQTSKQSVLSNTGAGSTGAFLQTLSQMSMQDDGTQVAEENASVAHDEAHLHGAAADFEEESPRENEFNVWCSKLNKFFSQYLFPSWSHLEVLRTETAKHSAEAEETHRLKSVELVAQRRRQMRSQEPPPPPPEEPAPELEGPPNPIIIESNPSGNDTQVSEVTDLLRPTSSTMSVRSSKSGKFKKKK